MKNISSIFDLTSFCDHQCIAAKSSAPGSPEIQTIASELADKLLGIDIVPYQSAIYEALILTAAEAPDSETREAAKQRLKRQLETLSVKKPGKVENIGAALLSSLFMTEALRPCVMKCMIAMPRPQVQTIYRLAREMDRVDQAHRAEFVAKAIETLNDKPYEFVRAMREMIDAVGRGVCPVVDMVDRSMDQYTQSAVYIAEVLQREYNVRVQSVPAAANSADHINPNG